MNFVACVRANHGRKICFIVIRITHHQIRRRFNKLRYKFFSYAGGQDKALSSNAGLPTIAESGLPGFQASGWFGVLAAAATPVAIIDRLNQTIAAIMQQPDVRSRLLAQGAEPLSGPPSELRNLLVREKEVWSRVIREAGVKPD